jgi:hypothetical protein
LTALPPEEPGEDEPGDDEQAATINAAHSRIGARIRRRRASPAGITRLDEPSMLFIGTDPFAEQIRTDASGQGANPGTRGLRHRKPMMIRSSPGSFPPPAGDLPTNPAQFDSYTILPTNIIGISSRTVLERDMFMNILNLPRII